jgi:tetratricopeptide (TPR) repeat protein
MAEVDTSMANSWKDQQADIPVTIAQAYITAKEYDKASATLRGLVDANPNNLTYVRSLANVYAQSEKPDSASAVYSRLLQRNDLSTSDLYQIGIGLYSIDKFQDAAAAFKKETQQAPKDRDAFEMWARSLQLAQTKDSTLVTPANLTELQTAAEGWLALDPDSRVGMLILAQTTNKAKNEARTNELVTKMDALQVGVTDLQLRRVESGGASLSGSIENFKATQGNPVTLTFTFYDKSGAALGTAEAKVPAGVKDGKTPFSVDFKSDQQVEGYTYQLTL